MEGTEKRTLRGKRFPRRGNFVRIGDNFLVRSIAGSTSSLTFPPCPLAAYFYARSEVVLRIYGLSMIGSFIERSFNIDLLRDWLKNN